jgi:crossover junction endodeoxyribonuclease RusA
VTPATRLLLPYPPSVNHYWRHVGAKVLISRTGWAYRSAVAAAAVVQQAHAVPGRLAVTLLVRPPDRRRRDLDNLCKSVLDALAHAGVYEDDSQVDRLTVERRPPKAGGELLAVVEPFPG